MNCEELKKKMLDSCDSLGLFSALAMSALMENSVTNDIMGQTCADGHTFSQFVPNLATKLFNTMSNNVAAHMNDSIRNSKKRGSSFGPGDKKVKKLQSCTK